MRFLSLFSGIEAASVAWIPLGWTCAGVAEIEPFPCAVLQHHYPEVPNLGDVTKITREQVEALGPLDLVCGGFPCQDLSVAGKRKGMTNADGSATRSGLFFDAMRIAEWADSRWLFIENVPGMFSSNAGRDFAAVVGAMAGCEFGVPPDGWQSSGVAVGPLGLVEWTVLDAQYHGLAQRRRRVFLVRDSGDWASRPPLFLESYRLQGHPAPRRETGKAAPTIPSRSTAGGGLGTDFDCDGGLIEAFGGNNTAGPIDVATARNACASASGRMDFESETFLVSHSLRGEGFDASEDGTGRGTPLVPVAIQNATRGQDQNGLGIQQDDVMYTLDRASQHAVAFSCKDYGNDATGDLAPTMRSMGHDASHANGGGQLAVAIAFDSQQITSAANRTRAEPGLPVSTIAKQSRMHVALPMAVRRLTPDECEKLQGFPPGYTAIPYRNKIAADGPRYKSLGNSWATPCAKWIGQRIEAVEAITAQQREAA